jgi:hypothetical protein
VWRNGPGGPSWFGTPNAFKPYAIDHNGSKKEVTAMIQHAIKNTFDRARGLDSEDILSAFGLERKRSALDALLPAAGLFVAGLATGAGIGLLLAPKPGRQMRRDIQNELNKFSGHAGPIVHEARAALTQKTPETPGSKPPAIGAFKAIQTAPHEAADTGSHAQASTLHPPIRP